MDEFETLLQEQLGAGFLVALSQSNYYNIYFTEKAGIFHNNLMVCCIRIIENEIRFHDLASFYTPIVWELANPEFDLFKELLPQIEKAAAGIVSINSNPKHRAPSQPQQQ